MDVKTIDHKNCPIPMFGEWDSLKTLESLILLPIRDPSRGPGGAYGIQFVVQGLDLQTDGF